MIANNLKKSILLAAIQGKLTSQFDSDGNAFDQIGNSKNDFFQDTEDLFEIPDNWRWTKLENVSQLDGGFAFKSTNYQTKGTRVLRISDFNEAGLVNKKIVYYEYDESLARYLVKPNDIVLCMTGGTVGKNYYFENLNEVLLLNQRVARISANETVIASKYLNYVIKSHHIQSEINKIKNSTNDNISMKNIKNFMIPIPPIKEQMQIIDKLQSLLGMVQKISLQD